VPRPLATAVKSNSIIIVLQTLLTPKLLQLYRTQLSHNLDTQRRANIKNMRTP